MIEHITADIFSKKYEYIIIKIWINEFDWRTSCVHVDGDQHDVNIDQIVYKLVQQQ